MNAKPSVIVVRAASDEKQLDLLADRPSRSGRRRGLNQQTHSAVLPPSAARACFAVGFRAGDIVHNYHLTPDGFTLRGGRSEWPYAIWILWFFRRAVTAIRARASWRCPSCSTDDHNVVVTSN
jgi:hypothetical protein